MQSIKTQPPMVTCLQCARYKLDSTLYTIVEWKIADVRCDVVQCLSLIMVSNSYSWTKELHCGRWRDIPPGLCQFPLAQRHSSGTIIQNAIQVQHWRLGVCREAPSEHSNPWPYRTTNVMHWILFIRQILLLSSTCTTVSSWRWVLDTRNM